jgi:putative nucleotidyltransferase with HDIG domain
MVLTQDIFSNQGTLLAHAGTLVDETVFRRLARAGIRVQGDPLDIDLSEWSPRGLPDTSSIPPQKLEEFSGFKASYEDREKEVGQCLMQIGNGEAIDLDKTYELTDRVISRLEHKTDVFLYLSFMKDFDNHTFSHCTNVSLLCHVFGTWLNFSPARLMELTVAGILHDVGKTQIPIEILNKTGRLTPEEFKIVQNHTVAGYKLLLQQKIPQEIRLAALQHHEKTDGSGYPLRLKAEQISEYSRIVAICDIYDAMTSTRCYREKICPFEVISTFENGVYGQLDTQLLFLFLDNIAYHYLNCNVALSDGREGEVIFIPDDQPSKPMVRTADGIVDLREHPHLSVQRIL